MEPLLVEIAWLKAPQSIAKGNSKYMSTAR
jgi:hypothetical protein